jgi:Na+/proline symporter
MSAIDAAIVGAFFVYVIVNGLRARGRASTGLEQYFLAGRSLSGRRGSAWRRRSSLPTRRCW